MKTKQHLIQLCLCGAPLLVLPFTAQAQFNYTTANGQITITKYTSSGRTVTIPGTINGLPVTSIGVAGGINTSGVNGGAVSLYGADGVSLASTAVIDAHADGYG